MSKGGPDGGDGGAGGNIFIIGDPSLNTLLHLRYHSTWMGRRGAHGGGKLKRGANGTDVTIPVAIGTLVWRLGDDGDRDMVADVTSTERVLVARGGVGGSGNAHFVSAIQREPVLAETGESGERGELLLELKLLADVGLIGQPNAGKSTLLSCCSMARPEIAAYPFTTTDPVLGVVELKYNSFVMMEVPGLVEGAHKGVGLGHEFLRHAERARVLVHLLDGVSEDVVGDWRRINGELESFSPSLARKPQVVAVNKLDIPEVRERMPGVRRDLGTTGTPAFFVSAATGEGVDGLLSKVLEELDTLSTSEPSKSRERPATGKPRPEQPFRVRRENEVYVVDAPRVERLMPLADLRDYRAVVQLWKELQRLGVVRALEEQGVQPGDTVRLGGVELEWS